MRSSFNRLKSNEQVFEETQTLCAGCSKAEPKIFAPPQTPSRGAQDHQNLISWRWSLPSPTDRVWWRSMQAISSYRGNKPTNKQTNTKTANTANLCTIDLSKAFDKVNHYALFIKLMKRHIPDQLKICFLVVASVLNGEILGLLSLKLGLVLDRALCYRRSCLLYIYWWSGCFVQTGM